MVTWFRKQILCNWHIGNKLRTASHFWIWSFFDNEYGHFLIMEAYGSMAYTKIICYDGSVYCFPISMNKLNVRLVNQITNPRGQHCYKITFEHFVSWFWAAEISRLGFVEQWDDSKFRFFFRRSPFFRVGLISGRSRYFIYSFRLNFSANAFCHSFPRRSKLACYF